MHVLVIVQIFIGVIGVAGNATVCLVVRKLASQGGNVNILIVYQACVDLVASVLLISTAFTILFPPGSPPQNYVMGTLYCIFWYFRVILWTTFTMSTFSLLVITLERYIAVIYPIWYRKFSRTVATILIITAWIFAPLMQVAFAFTQIGHDDGRCIVNFKPPSFIAAQGIAIFIWEFLLPCTLMAFGFTRICIKLVQQHKRVGVHEMSTRVRENNVPISASAPNQSKAVVAEGEPQADSSLAELQDSKRLVSGAATTDDNINVVPNGESSSSEPQARSSKPLHRNVTITLAIVFAVYVICWTPAQVLFLLKNLGINPEYQEGSHLEDFAILMVMLNSIFNPIIYALRFKQYQQALRTLFKRAA